MGERCANHPGRESLTSCHSCGKRFCRRCLDKGKKDYYCREERCHALLRQEDVQFEKVIGARQWKRKSWRFYRKLGLILFFVWILLTAVGFYRGAYNGNYVLVPLLSLNDCVFCFIGISVFWWHFIYRHYVWESPSNTDQ